MDGANRGGLWRHPNFARLWSATTVSVFGDQFTRLALPLVAVENLNASAAEMGLLTTAQSLPILLFSLVAGVWVDRCSKRLILIVSDVTRGFLLATIPVAALVGVLQLTQLYLVAFLGGTLNVTASAARNGDRATA